MANPVSPRRGTPSVALEQAEFRRRFLSQYIDPAFTSLSAELERLGAAAWDAYSHHRKAPRTRKAGLGFYDPTYDLAVDWLAARDAIDAAQMRHDDPTTPDHILIVSGSARSEHTCAGEMSKAWRLAEIARETLSSVPNVTVEHLELHRIAAEYGRHIHPCKACFSTSPALCHWPCSCYPNYSLGQTQDWMNEIYPMWVAARGIMIVTPVNWYQSSSPLKLMMDRLVCADGGNPDPTRTHGKDAQRAQEIELDGWDYPKHLAGRLFSVIVYGDSEGAHNVRHALSDWLQDMELLPAGSLAELDRYIGYWQPYALGHAALDEDWSLQEEVRNAARALHLAIDAQRKTGIRTPDSRLKKSRQK